jgi:hypothetical protein
MHGYQVHNNVHEVKWTEGLIIQLLDVQDFVQRRIHLTLNCIADLGICRRIMSEKAP